MTAGILIANLLKHLLKPYRMAKDPAFLFYPAEASEDTQFLNRLERGAYFDLLKAQKRFGRFTLEQITKVLGSDFEAVWPALKICLTYVDDMYFIEWVDESINKRRAYSESRSNNRKAGKNKISTEKTASHDDHMINTGDSYVNHMGNGNRNINTVEDKGGVGEKEEGAGQPIVWQAVDRWRAVNPKYPFDQQADLRAIYGLLSFIGEQGGINGQITAANDAERARLLDQWGKWCTLISESPMFSRYDLSTIERFKKQQIQKELTDGKPQYTTSKGQYGKSAGAISIANDLASRLGLNEQTRTGDFEGKV